MKAIRPLALVLVLLAACSDAAAVDEAAARQYVSEWAKGWGDAASMLEGPYRTLDETLPNVVFAGPAGSGSTSSHVVVGEIVDVEKGKGFRVDGDDAPDGIPTDFDDKRARWWTVHARVRVDRGIASDTPSEIMAMFPSSGPAKFRDTRAGLMALGTVVLFLRDDDLLVPYDPSLYVVGHDYGLLVATVAADGTLGMPMVSEERAKKLLAKTPTLTTLEEAGRHPRTIPMVPWPGGPAEQRRADGL